MNLFYKHGYEVHFRVVSLAQFHPISGTWRISAWTNVHCFNNTNAINTGLTRVFTGISKISGEEDLFFVEMEHSTIAQMSTAQSMMNLLENVQMEKSKYLPTIFWQWNWNPIVLVLPIWQTNVSILVILLALCLISLFGVMMRVECGFSTYVDNIARRQTTFVAKASPNPCQSWWHQALKDIFIHHLQFIKY